MKAFVTGAAGFIGSQVVKKLLEKNYQVKAMVLPGDNLINLRGLDVETVYGDILSESFLEKNIHDCSAVFHLAAIYAIWLKNPAKMYEVNVAGTRNLFNVCKQKKNIERIVYTSSVAVFAGQGKNRDATEESPFSLAVTGDDYCRSKYQSHKVVQEFIKQGMDVVITAPSVPIGPGDYGPTPSGRMLLDMLHLPVTTVIDSYNNFLDVRDCGEGHVLALEKGKSGREYILGNENYSMKEFLGIARAVLQLDRPSIDVPYSLLYPASRVLKFIADNVTHKAPMLTPNALKVTELGLRADCQRAFKELGLPQRHISESIRDAIKWFNEYGYVKDKSLAKAVG